MRPPLIRQGEGPAAAFQRIVKERAEQQANIERICQDTANSNVVSRATAAGDERKLRGIPAIGRGVAGAIAGTNPHSVLR